VWVTLTNRFFVFVKPKNLNASVFVICLRVSIFAETATLSCIGAVVWRQNRQKPVRQKMSGTVAHATLIHF
jgi:hypothetical protein